jgi:hypothetical protein
MGIVDWSGRSRAWLVLAAGKHLSELLPQQLAHPQVAEPLSNAIENRVPKRPLRGCQIGMPSDRRGESIGRTCLNANSDLWSGVISR